MKRKSPFRRWALGAATLLVLLAAWSSPTPRQTLSSLLGLALPPPAQVEVQDSHGGFHGDGVYLARAAFSPEGWTQLLARTEDWRPLPLEEALDPAWLEDFGLPPVAEGRYLLIDRYALAYGEPCPFNPLQNATLGVLDTSAQVLYVLKTDF